MNLVQYPVPPQGEKGLLGWAQKLMVALNAEKRIRDLNDAYSEVILTGATIEWKQNATINRIAATGNITINATPAKAGMVYFIISNDATPRTITFGTNFLAAGTLVGTASKTAVVGFLSDGFTLYEVSRTVGL